MNRTLTVLLGCLMLAAPAAQAQFLYTTNNCTITITGYTGPGGAVNIAAQINGLPVASIGDSAFAGRNVTSVNIPHNITNIGFYAFGSCRSLTNIIIGDSVINIGNRAFDADYNLTNVTIPNSVTSIGDGVFWECFGLVSATIPDSVTSIGTAVFYDCEGLTNVVIGNSVTNIGGGTFYDCSGLTSVAIPDGVISIGDSAFAFCTSLTSVTIPNGVTSIENGAFLGCGLTRVMIPENVTYIGVFTFDRCFSLKAITVAAQNPVYSSLNGVLFDKNHTELIEFPAGLGTYPVPDGVTSIGNAAFVDCANLTNVTIGRSVTNIGDSAFAHCSGLTGVYFSGDAPAGVGKDVFVHFTGTAPPDEDPATIYYLPNTSGWSNTFAGRPTALWRPQVQTGDASFGVRTNQFGFNINWASGQTVVVEASTSLTNPVWQPVQTNTLTSDSIYSSDPQWTNYPARFYRLRSQ